MKQFSARKYKFLIFITAGCFMVQRSWALGHQKSLVKSGGVDISKPISPDPAKLIISTAGDNWHFLMGPAGSPIEGAWFYHGAPGKSKDAISISCRRSNGDQVILFDLPSKLRGKIAPHLVDAAISIAGDIHTLEMHERGVGKRHLILYATGSAPSAIAYAMGALPIGLAADISVKAPDIGLVSTPIPTLRTTSAAMGRICSAWSRKMSNTPK